MAKKNEHDDHIEELAEHIYKSILHSSKKTVSVHYIITKCNAFESIDNIQNAINLLVEREVIAWETKKSYGDTIYVRG